MKTIADRLKEERTAHGWSQTELAKKAKVAQGTIGNVESGARKKPRELLEIAAALGVRAEWLQHGEEPKHPPLTGIGQATLDSVNSSAVGTAHADQAQAIDLDNNPDYPAVRRVQFRLSAGASGFGVEYKDEDSEPIVFRRDWFLSRGYVPDKLFAVRVSNGSMEPGLWAGDTVVTNTADTEPRDGEVYAVNFEGELVIKRLVRDEGRWWLKSDNADQGRYPRKVVGAGVFILGRIVHKQSEHV